jgi:hypothetical protein
MMVFWTTGIRLIVLMYQLVSSAQMSFREKNTFFFVKNSLGFK